MIELLCQIRQDPATGKTQITIHAAREEPTTLREELEANAIVEMVAQYIAAVGKDGTTLVHRPIPLIPPVSDRTSDDD